MKEKIITFLSDNKDSPCIDYGNIMSLVKNTKYKECETALSALLSDSLVEEDELGFYSITSKGEHCYGK